MCTALNAVTCDKIKTQTRPLTHKRHHIAISVGSILDKIDPNIMALYHMISIHLFVWLEGDAVGRTVIYSRDCSKKFSNFWLMKFCYFLHIVQCCSHILILIIYYNQLMIFIRGNVLCINSSDAGEHQQAWYWLCRTDNMYCCCRV